MALYDKLTIYLTLQKKIRSFTTFTFILGFLLNDFVLQLILLHLELKLALKILIYSTVSKQVTAVLFYRVNWDINFR